MKQKKNPIQKNLKAKRVYEGLGDREGTSIILILFIILTNH